MLPIRTTAAKLARQPNADWSAAPNIGATAGTAPIKAPMKLRVRAARSASNRSRTMARASTTGAQAPTAWQNRAAIRRSIDRAIVHRNVANRNRPRPHRSTGLRPNLSEIGPYTICPMAKPTRNRLNVSCVPASLALRSLAIQGSDGRYMSVDSGPIEIRTASMTVMAADSGRSFMGRVADRKGVCGERR